SELGRELTYSTCSELDSELTSLAAKASATPWDINALIAALIIRVVAVVVARVVMVLESMPLRVVPVVRGLLPDTSNLGIQSANKTIICSKASSRPSSSGRSTLLDHISRTGSNAQPLLLMTSQLNFLRRDRRFHARTARLMESEVRVAREAWAQAMDASDTARSMVRALQTTVLAQETEIRELRAADRGRQAQLVKALTLLRTLQTQMVALQSQQRPARDPTHPDKIPPRKAPRTITTLATTTATTPMINAVIRALISRGVADALAKHEIQRNNNVRY
nr:hypothetical protein [Tanacetum cinerariifolium]